MSSHLSLLENNSKKLRKSPHVMSPFHIENNFENSSSMSHHLSQMKDNSE
jgi:hypothetical protein